MPASEDPTKDREIYLKILSMDKEGLWLRKDKPIPMRTLYANLTASERGKYFEKDARGRLRYVGGVTRKQKKEL